MFLRNTGMEKFLYYVFMDYELSQHINNNFGLGLMLIPSIGISVTTTYELEKLKAEMLFEYVMGQL